MANQITTKDLVDYLVKRRFPLSYLLNIHPSLSDRGPPPNTTQLRKEVDAFKEELAALSTVELVARYDAEKAKALAERLAKAEQEEREQFFNQPGSTADYEHWSRAAHWTLDEAIALSFGRAPEVVRWDRLQKLASLGSPFVAQYARRRDLALRAATWKQLYDPVLPGIFLAWARRTDISVPAELIEAVEKRGVQVADWKTRYDEAMAALESEREFRESAVADWRKLYDEARATLTKNHADWLDIADEKNRRIASLEAEIVSLQQTLAKLSEAPVGKELSTRERESLLKLVIGMAREGYAYDPGARRSETPSEIAADLAKLGIALDVDTVRKWLREAADLLPGS